MNSNQNLFTSVIGIGGSPDAQAPNTNLSPGALSTMNTLHMFVAAATPGNFCMLFDPTSGNQFQSGPRGFLINEIRWFCDTLGSGIQLVRSTAPFATADTPIPPAGVQYQLAAINQTAYKCEKINFLQTYRESIFIAANLWVGIQTANGAGNLHVVSVIGQNL